MIDILVWQWEGDSVVVYFIIFVVVFYVSDDDLWFVYGCIGDNEGLYVLVYFEIVKYGFVGDFVVWMCEVFVNIDFFKCLKIVVNVLVKVDVVGMDIK